MLQFGKERAHQLVEGAAYAANTFKKNYRKDPRWRSAWRNTQASMTCRSSVSTIF
jgi:hypothetical protein